MLRHGKASPSAARIISGGGFRNLMVGDTLHHFQSPLRNLQRRNRINPRAVLGALRDRLPPCRLHSPRQILLVVEHSTETLVERAGGAGIVLSPSVGLTAQHLLRKEVRDLHEAAVCFDHFAQIVLLHPAHDLVRVVDPSVFHRGLAVRKYSPTPTHADLHDQPSQSLYWNGTLELRSRP
jgi:hypothetical protein